VARLISDTDLTAALEIDLLAIVIAPLLFWAALVLQRRRRSHYNDPSVLTHS